MKFYDICEEIKSIDIKEVAVYHFLSVYTGKHEVTAFYYYPNIKKLSIYILSEDTYEGICVEKTYLLKVVHHLPVTESDMNETN